MTTHSTPAIAGVAQVIQRPGDWTDPAQALGPIELMTQGAREAAADAGVPGLLTKVTWIGVAADGWIYSDPGGLVADRIGAGGAHTRQSTVSGTAPQELVGAAAEAIARGETEVALVLGGDATWSQRRITQEGGQLPWVAEGTGNPHAMEGYADEMIGEMGLLRSPAVAYALFEDRLRSELGRSPAEHQQQIAALWSRFAQVAAANPYAWDRSAPTAQDIAQVTPDNRMIAFPYPKAMVANNTVDLASAVLLCSTEAAQAAGVPGDRLVFPLVSASSHDTWQIAARHELHQVPALGAAARAALGHAKLGIGDVEHVDLYACFPAIVQMTARELGLSLDRELTVTGGLGFAGSALVNSAGHAIVAMVGRVRGGGTGLVQGNGGMATKHAFGVYADRPTVPFRRIDAQPQADLRPRPVTAVDTPGVVEASTVHYGRSGPEALFAIVTTPDGARSVHRRSASDPASADLISAAQTEGLTGVPLG